MTTITHPDEATVVALAGWPGPVVSIYLPADPPRRDGDLSSGLRSSAQWAKDALVSVQGLDPAAAEDLLALLTAAASSDAALAEAGLAPEPSSKGGAWFVASGRISCLSLPVSTGPYVEVADGPDLLRLLPTVDAGPAYFVLAISQRRPRVFRADRYGIEPLDVEDMPTGIEDALWYVKREPELNRHGSQDYRKEDLHQYLHQVDKALAPVLAGSTAPLVVVGVGYEAAMFVNETHYRHVVSAPVVANPDTLDVPTIHERTSALVRALPGAASGAAERARSLAGTGKALVDPEEILAAALNGAVGDVLVARSATESGERHAEPISAVPGMVKAVNAAIVTGANVYVVEDSELPVGSPIAAVLRY